jgi:hypothetical protein
VIEGLVAYCDFSDPWGNLLGFYQVLGDGTGASLGSSGRAHRTEAERRVEAGAWP